MEFQKEKNSIDLSGKRNEWNCILKQGVNDIDVYSMNFHFEANKSMEFHFNTLIT